MARISQPARPRTIALLAAGALALAGCGGSDGPEGGGSSGPDGVSRTSSTGGLTPAIQEFFVEHDLAEASPREMIDHLDAMPVADRPTDILASVRPATLVFSDADGNEYAVPTDEEEVYVSIAPYVKTTHECHFHSLTTCLGELRGEKLDVTITDSDGGDVPLDEQVTTFDNGFFGVWLPKDRTFEVEVTHDGRTARQTVSTGPEDATCITTMRLT